MTASAIALMWFGVVPRLTADDPCALIAEFLRAFPEIFIIRLINKPAFDKGREGAVRIDGKIGIF